MNEETVLTLVLDIDLTMLVAIEESHHVAFGEGKHQASDYGYIATTLYGQNQHIVVIINPDRLSALLQYACDQGVELLILTAGCWDGDSIKNILANHLPVLSDEARSKITNCTFISTLESREHFPDKPLMEISHLSKEERLFRYLEIYCPEKINQHHFLLLDDSDEHIKAFNQSKRLNCQGILATTNTWLIDEINAEQSGYDITGFYQKTQEAITNLLTNIELDSTSRILQTLSSPKPSPLKIPYKRDHDQKTHLPLAKKLRFGFEVTDDSFYIEGLDADYFGLIPSEDEVQEASTSSFIP